MLFNMSSLGLSQPTMKVELRLDKKEPAYTPRDTVLGEIILHTESPADLSTIVLNLSGTATSRLSQSRRTETHNVCKKMAAWAESCIWIISLTPATFSCSKSLTAYFLQTI